ncbi:unnamed protein product [Brugia pahangi]|uniref:Zinc_ribbon_2 domain-containing protein n=1 Tax=Brugia pahangi TaxID=6280 RepID=A0A0N4TZY3_BRUPA|nr:unnamed protein product [Brugia pahangi]
MTTDDNEKLVYRLAQIITDVRNRWHCLSCISRRSIHFCPACGNVISKQYLTEVIKKNSTSSST